MFLDCLDYFFSIFHSDGFFGVTMNLLASFLPYGCRVVPDCFDKGSHPAGVVIVEIFLFPIYVLEKQPSV